MTKSYIKSPNKSRGCVKSVGVKFGNDQIFDMENFDEVSRRIEWSKNEFSHSLALEESLSLFFLRKVEEYFDGPRSVAIKVALQVHDGVIPLLPDGFLIAQLFRKPLSEEHLRMHPNNQHFLVIGTVEDADPSARRQTAGRAPEKIMLQFFCARMLETVDFTALRVDARQDVADRAILSGSVHGLKNKEHRIAVGRIEEVLQSAQIPNIRIEKLLVMFSDLYSGFMSVAHFFSLIFFPPGTRKSLGLIFILNVLFRQRIAHYCLRACLKSPASECARPRAQQCKHFGRT